ncbi:MAG: undecaprenyl-diphosphate phosphatase [Candidatus Pacebacteria bacterium]|nr:undecaprenyl-diphosphate phosphatase [Candidatus Paceibacterota bacterium]
MTYLDALILGIVEGITEFLPVSSTGHMILVSSLLQIGEDSFTKSFEIIIQLGAILAVVFVYRKKIFSNFALMYKVFLAFLPTAVIGLALYSVVKRYLLGNVYVVIASLFFGGIIIWLFEKKNMKGMVAQVDTDLVESSVTVKQALYIGLFQSIAIVPGVSRSAATIIGGQMLGLSRKVIVEFSFLLAIPVMLAATALDVYKHHDSFVGNQLEMLSIGFITAFFVALLAIKTFLAYIQKHSFAAFGVYRIVLAIVFLGVLYFV